jgi:hypothetical protein
VLGLTGGRCPPSPVGRAVGRIVVGPSGETLREGAGLGGATRDRTTWGRTVVASVTGADAAAAGSTETSGVVVTVAAGTATGASGAGAGVLVTRVGRGAGSAGASAGAAALDLLALVAFAAFWASAGTSRRSPSASARRRIRSAWASSIDAEGLEAPMPSFWASASNSLLVSPSSLESSCTRIFFGAKTFPYFVFPHVRRAQFPILSQLRRFPGRKTTQHRYFRLTDAGAQGPSDVGKAYFTSTGSVAAPPHTATLAPPQVPRTVSGATRAHHVAVVSTTSTHYARPCRGYASSSVTVSTTTTSSTSPSASVITVSTTTASTVPSSATTAATVSSTTTSPSVQTSSTTSS